MVGDCYGVIFQLDARPHKVCPDVIRVVDRYLDTVVLLHQFADRSGIGSVALLKADRLVEHPSKGPHFVLVSLVRGEAMPVLLLYPKGRVVDAEYPRSMLRLSRLVAPRVRC